VGDAEALLAAVDADPPDVCIVDIRMPPTNTPRAPGGAAPARAPPRGGRPRPLPVRRNPVRDRAPGPRCRRVGYLLKDRVGDVSELLAAVRSVVAGRSVIDPTVVSRLVGRRRQADPMETLTAREREVLEQMAEGRSNRAIGERLFLSPRRWRPTSRRSSPSSASRTRGRQRRCSRCSPGCAATARRCRRSRTASHDEDQGTPARSGRARRRRSACGPRRRPRPRGRGPCPGR